MNADHLVAAIFFLVLVLSVALGVWVHFLAPCHAIDWMPVKDIPARCLIR